ncbi:septum formation family protein [Micromonospora sp. 4G57]|uniref:Septum formation family protein n=1 Tax=Micromonospora sicca TaxID=2202420 RepID=A0ABU5JGC9_9ACTN|nr:MULTISPECIES: septum formation family protein [unclassified Micromonospora]MDZ5445728.1 septum formation family protein [Micromonospora sp. 4G57]MDZ5491670.1 septum formation family protein [Micromonospora sp. 4G53]
MKRWRGVTAWAALVMVVLAGCGTPAGTDGDLTDDWRPVGKVEQFTPKVGDCHLIAEPSSYLTSYQPVECGRAHLVETIHLGTFTGALAERPTPPPVGSAAIRPAFADCDAKATAFVGGDWRGARLSVQVVPPSPLGWTGGSRWYRCDLFELDTVDGGTFRDHPNDHAIQHTGSLRDALKRPSPLAFGCLTEDRWGNFQQVGCATAHQFEYVGAWTVPDGRYADAGRHQESIHAGCRTVVARYAKVPVDRMLRYRTGTSYQLPSEEAWARGDRGVRCFYWSSGKKVTRSIKSGGTKALPVN